MLIPGPNHHGTIQAAAIQVLASAMASRNTTSRLPLLFGPNNQPLPLRPSTPEHALSRSAAKRAGSMKNWVPQRLTSRQQETMEREEICRRSSDLINNDPHASGLCESFSSTVVGAGLKPHFCLNGKELGMKKNLVRTLQGQQLKNIRLWWPMADAGGRMNFGQIQYLIKRNLFQYGEYLVLLPMIDDPLRPFALACQVIHPLRLKTPIDKLNDPAIRDGVELGSYGEPLAYWIKKSSPSSRGVLPDHSANFVRIERRASHRYRVLHGFIQRDAEQVRGVPELSPAMKMSRDLNDLLDAELVSNIVTAAYSMFIETSGDSWAGAEGLATGFEEGADGKITRYQEFEPGQVLYGNAGEKPHPIAASRPGTTFEPFTKLIKKSMALAIGLPYPVAFKDVDGVSFAGFRSAMLEAWRVFSCHRQWLGDDICQPINIMLQEEAWLRGRLQVKEFYPEMAAITAANWLGAPKGDIEPYKAAQADILEIEHNLKTHEAVILERGGQGLRATADTLEEEWELIEEKGLPDARKEMTPDAAAPNKKAKPPANNDQPQENDDEQ